MKIRPSDIRTREKIWGEAGNYKLILSDYAESQKTLDDFLIIDFNLASDNVQTFNGRMDPLG